MDIIQNPSQLMAIQIIGLYVFSKQDIQSLCLKKTEEQASKDGLQSPVRLIPWPQPRHQA
jgi:hypothetical protein